MIQTETVTINGAEYQHTYSDAGYMIERDGVQYADAIDPVGLGRTYTETTTKAETDAIVESSASDELVDIIMGK
jgi:hypothetical protein